MDQVRAFFSVVWTQRFWVLSIVGTIVAVLCWNMAASDLSSDFTKRQGEINTAHNNVKTINGERFHPNDDVIAGDTKQAQVQRDMVREVWQELYDAQRADVLKWPETIGDEFVKYMENRKFGDNISEVMRGFYHNYIQTRFDSLLKIVQARKTANGRSGGRAGAGGYGGEYGGAAPALAAEEEEDYLVEWIDQGALQKKLDFPKKPTTLQVWVTQEDLWVYETLLKVIDQTNKAKGAVRPDNTAVRAIVQLQVGAMASSPSTGKVIIPQPTEGEGGGGGEYGGEYGGEFGGYGGGEYGGYGGGGEFGGGYGGGEYGGYGGGGEYGGYGGGGEFGGGYGGGGEYGGGGRFGMGEGGGGDGTLLSRRYLDAEGKPDEGGSVESVVSTEFRQLPIRMRLMMDEKFIPTLLLKCANATLPIEVKQVRINPSKSGAGFGGGQARSNIRGLNQMSLDDLTEVIIRGAVYIYNEPDTERLTIPGEDLAQPGDEIAQVTSP